MAPRSASPTFNRLCQEYRREFRHLDSDLDAAFANIAKDFRAAKSARRVQAGELVEVYKYRQNSRDIKGGNQYGWRIYALYHKAANTLYPILIFPKTAMQDASDTEIIGSIREVRHKLGFCIRNRCRGVMVVSQPREFDASGMMKMQCSVCQCIKTWTGHEKRWPVPRLSTQKKPGALKHPAEDLNGGYLRLR